MTAAGAVLVTGAAGFIGSTLTERLLAAGERVVGYDSFDPYYDPAVKRANLARALAHPRFTLLEADIRDRAALAAAMDRGPYRAVVHLAARAGVRPSLEDPVLYADVNVTGTAAVLDAVQRAGVPRVVYASSSSVYGANSRAPFREDDPADAPMSPYAATKRACEIVAEAFHRQTGVPILGMRFFTVYGPRQRPDMAIHLFTRRIARGEPVTVFGDGSARRDFTYVDDAVDAVVAALDRGSGHRVYNVGEEATITVTELIELLAQVLGRPAQVEHRPPCPGDVPLTHADVSRARSELGYHPRVALREGIERFVRWYQATHP